MKRAVDPFHLILKKTLNATLKRDLKLKNMVANVEPRRSSGPQVEGLIQINNNPGDIKMNFDK